MPTCDITNLQNVHHQPKRIMNVGVKCIDVICCYVLSHGTNKSKHLDNVYVFGDYVTSIMMNSFFFCNKCFWTTIQGLGYIVIIYQKSS